jgi:structural maintenance of chromosome 3 (chondroitin sulfate proteoglycan 6)
VEIIFDNSDGRLPVERKGTVSLKRVMSQKKDEYFLDNKSVTRSDIANLLEGAGMTKSNPYYFVQQGRIQELVKMSSADRLRLLMNVAGTTTYEERRAESLRIMESTDAQMEEVEAIMATIDLRIKDLEKEKVVLDKYNALTAERDSLMHLKYTRALEEAEDKLASLAATAVDVKAWKERSEATQARIAAESEKARVSDALGVAELELAKVQRDITKLTALEEDAKGSVARAKEVVADDQRLMEAAEAELGKVVALVEETEAALRQAEADLVRTTAEEVEAEKTLVEAERERSVAEAKVGVDGQMFDTEKARLAFIHDRIKAMEAGLAANTARLKDAETAKADAAKELKEALKAAEVEVGREARVKAEAEHQADKLAACEAELTT